MNIPKPPNDLLLDSERKELFGRITEYVGGVFRYMTTHAVPRWTATEIARKYGLQNSNITMIQNYKKYKREISSTELGYLLTEELMNLKEIKDSCAKTDKERNFLDDKFKAIRLIKLAEKNNVNAAEVLENHLRGLGIDVTDD